MERGFTAFELRQAGYTPSQLREAGYAASELKAVGISGVEETFEPQVFQPFVMFFGMLFALPMYLALEARKRIRARSDPALRAELDAAPHITVHPRLEPLAGADAREP